MVIHTFGAFFGLSVALFYKADDAIKDKAKLGSGNYLSDLVSMIGTLFLFCYWPSFNGALATPIAMQRSIINTYLALACSVLAAITVATLTHGGKLDMEIILNASIAGGVVSGATCDMIVLPFGAMIAGFIAGTVSAFGFAYLNKFLQQNLKLHDTCGVLNLHGIPGIIGALTSAIVSSRAGDNFGSNFNSVYLATGRTAHAQAGFQLAGLAMSLGIAIGSGLLVGFITSRKWFQPVDSKNLFDDTYHWVNCEIQHQQLQDIKEHLSKEYEKQPKRNDGIQALDHEDEDDDMLH